jgi:hypothetical protein
VGHCVAEIAERNQTCRTLQHEVLRPNWAYCPNNLPSDWRLEQRHDGKSWESAAEERGVAALCNTMKTSLLPGGFFEVQLFKRGRQSKWSSPLGGS